MIRAKNTISAITFKNPSFLGKYFKIFFGGCKLSYISCKQGLPRPDKSGLAMTEKKRRA